MSKRPLDPEEVKRYAEVLGDPQLEHLQKRLQAISKVETEFSSPESARWLMALEIVTAEVKRRGMTT